jgi:uncharacterized protein YcbK (DUF882 family)
MQLTKNFKLSEFTESRTARQLGIDNTPGSKEIDSLRNLCVNILEPLRENLSEPIIINSGYRSEQLNHAVGGSLTSQHMKGEAADIRINGDASKILEALYKLGIDFDQAILYRKQNFLHVSLKKSGTNRRQKLLA